MFILLLLIWFIFNGKITLELTVLGVILCAGIYFFMCKFMDYSFEKDIALMRRGLFFLYYIWVLIVEIVKANIQVMHFVLTDREIAEPVIVSYKTRLKTRVGRVILSNSITLTPGTITISLEEDELTIHCLDKSMAEGMEDLIFEKLLETMENMKGIAIPKEQ
ncbi:MAG: Na+/H+ antiporter subunit E [Lachnospiraceae bacterium]|nr:Na+/H+ antiporter subunit E [Lachnospiraceae bacterium]